MFAKFSKVSNADVKCWPIKLKKTISCNSVDRLPGRVVMNEAFITISEWLYVQIGTNSLGDYSSGYGQIAYGGPPGYLSGHISRGSYRKT